jgi:hypothetical protein
MPCAILCFTPSFTKAKCALAVYFEISGQVNAAVPPPVRTNICPVGNERNEGVWGCSLAEAASIMEKFGYVLVQLDYSDAMYALIPLL